MHVALSLSFFRTSNLGIGTVHLNANGLTAASSIENAAIDFFKLRGFQLKIETVDYIHISNFY